MSREPDPRLANHVGGLIGGRDCKPGAHVQFNSYRGVFEARCLYCPTFTWALTEAEAITDWNDAMMRLKWRKVWTSDS